MEILFGILVLELAIISYQLSVVVDLLHNWSKAWRLQRAEELADELARERAEFFDLSRKPS